MPCFLLNQLLRIQALKLRYYEAAVFPDQAIVEPDLAASEFFPLDQDQIPVDGAGVAVGGFVVAVARGQVDGSLIFSSKRISFMGVRI